MKKLFKAHKPHLLVILLFLSYLLILPRVVGLMVPCLQHIPGKMYQGSECELLMALDRFMVLALIGFAISTLVLFVLIRKRGLKPLLICAIVNAFFIIAAYHLYIPQSEAAIKNASIILYDARKNP